MNITHKITAHALLLLAGWSLAAAQAEINPDHYPAEPLAAAIAPSPATNAQIRALQVRLDNYEQQLREKTEQVEAARQEAISAGIQGDGAGAYIDDYRGLQKELDVLRAALGPQIEQVRNLIAALASQGSPEVSSVAGSVPEFSRQAHELKKAGGHTRPLQAHSAKVIASDRRVARPIQ